MSAENKERLEKVPVGIPGLDDILEGGTPKGRSSLVTGSAGSGKTVLGLQYLVAGIREFNEPGVLVTFEEDPKDLARNVDSLGWNIQGLINKGQLAVVDASPDLGEQPAEVGAFDLHALTSRIHHAVQKTGAKRAVLDSIAAIFPYFKDANVIRHELRQIAQDLANMGITTLMTAERGEDTGAVSRFGVEEFVADNVIILRNHLEQEKRRRTIEILKLRGAPHQKGEHPFTIDAESGINVIPLSSILLTQKSSNIRIPTGSQQLDAMCGGGMFRDSVILVSGATGTGKTLMVTEFTRAAVENNERALLLAFEESREQLFRNAAAWGSDLEDAERRGLIRVVCCYPESNGLEDHLLRVRQEIEDFQPTRVAVDSLSALERVSSIKSFREFVIGLTSHIKMMQIAALFTNTTSTLVGGESITETHISTLTDAIILLRYVELQGQMDRGITILKMRGSWHEKMIRRYEIDNTGMHIGEPFDGISGILAGKPTDTRAMGTPRPV